MAQGHLASCRQKWGYKPGVLAVVWGLSLPTLASVRRILLIAKPGIQGVYGHSWKGLRGGDYCLKHVRLSSVMSASLK